MRFFVENSKLDLGDLTRKRPIREGGAGFIYDHPALPNQCIKIYKEERDPKTGRIKDRAASHEAKVRAMLVSAPDLVVAPNGTVQMAWPQAAIVDESRKFRGFVMPFIDYKESWGMNLVQNATLRKAKGIPNALILRLTAAINLSFLVDSLHRAGHCIVDLKPENLKVYGRPANKAGFVALLDCDGFFISSGVSKPTYPAELATPEFSHPNGISADGSPNLAWINQHPREQDLWSLSMLTFLLLNESGPFHGVPRNFPDYPSELSILARRHNETYAYGIRSNPRVDPKPESLHEWFSSDLRALFDRTFIGNSVMPSAVEWRRVLLGLQSQEYKCQENRNHWKLGDVCGQCEIESRAAKSRAPHTQVPAPMPNSRANSTHSHAAPANITSRQSTRAPPQAHATRPGPSPAPSVRPPPQETPWALIFVAVLIVVVIILAIVGSNRESMAKASAVQVAQENPLVVTPVTEWTAWVAPGEEIIVRAGPGLEYSQSIVMGEGFPIVTTGFTTDAEGTSWHEVRLPSGYRGFIAASVAKKSLINYGPYSAPQSVSESITTPASSIDPSSNDAVHNSSTSGDEGSTAPASVDCILPDGNETRMSREDCRTQGGSVFE